MSVLPILYSFRRCPYAIRARLAVLASGTCCVIREVKLSAKPPELIAVSPKATVPVMVLPNGDVMEQSLDIMRRVLGRSDPAGWLHGIDEALIETNDGPFKHHLDRAKYPDRYAADGTLHHDACAGLLGPIEERLTGSPYLCGERPGLTDAAIFPFVRQFAGLDRAAFDALPLPHARGWLDRWLAAPMFETVMLRLAPWRQGDPDTRFPPIG